MPWFENITCDSFFIFAVSENKTVLMGMFSDPLACCSITKSFLKLIIDFSRRDIYCET